MPRYRLEVTVGVQDRYLLADSMYGDEAVDQLVYGFAAAPTGAINGRSFFIIRGRGGKRLCASQQSAKIPLRRNVGACFYAADMPSDAIERWLSERAEALDSLVSVHAKVTGRRVGRKYDTKHLNRALFVALSAEFQGFSRDLHEGAAVHIANSLQALPSNARVVPVVLDALVKGRRLDRGNADFSALVTDFSTLGMNLGDELRRRYPARTAGWERTIRALNSARNGVAHSDVRKLTTADRDHGLTLATFRRWRSSLSGAAHAMDQVVGAYLMDLTGTQPW